MSPAARRRRREPAAHCGGAKLDSRTSLRVRSNDQESFGMTYRVYSGPPGTEAISPMEKDRWLYREFGLFDDALSWARHVNDGGRITLLIEGDDGTRLTKTEIAAALKHPEAAERQLHSHRSGREH
jgi:hypothetical protein